MFSKHFVLVAITGLALSGCGKEKEIEAPQKPAAPPPASEVVSASGSLKGGNMQVEVQIGNATAQEQVAGKNAAVEPNSAIKR